MRTRKEIHDQIKANIDKREELKQLNLKLSREAILLSDDEQRFTEQMEIISERVDRKLVKVERLIGRIHWSEKFYDDDKPTEFITIDRTQVVRVDGNWNW